MMSLAARTSRRTVLLSVLFGFFMIATMVVIKDLNDKLAVMTSSNASYQRMTDKQMERIKNLQVSDLRGFKYSFYVYRYNMF